VPRCRDVLSIHGLELECVVGLYPHERDTPQPLKIDVDLGLDTESAAESERIGRTIDYDAMAVQIAFLLQAGRFELLETAAHVLALHLLSPPAPGERRSKVELVRLRLTKPAALGGRGIPSLEIEREASWARLESTATPFGSIDLIHQSRHTRIYRLHLAAKRSITRRSGSTLEAELVLGEGLERDGVPVPRGAEVRDGDVGARAYVNTSLHPQSLLCVDRDLTAAGSGSAEPVRMTGG
jgi:FolB domain-containing protein